MRRASTLDRTLRGRARTTALALGACVGTVAIITMALLAPRRAQAQVSVDELEVHMRLTGEHSTITQVIPVRNEDDRPHQVRIGLGDWMRDSLGNNVFLEADSLPSSCGPRLRVFPQTFQIAAGATELVRVAYEPAPADSGCWSIVFVETVTPPPATTDAQGSFLTIEVRTGVKIYVHRREEEAYGRVEDAWVREVWRPLNPGSAVRDSVQVREATIQFVNEGTAHVRVKSTMEIRSLDNELLHVVDGGEAPMTPGATRHIAMRIPPLSAGDYVAIVLLDYGGDEVAAAQLDIRIP